MARFAYSALSREGDLVTGEIESPDAHSVIARLHEQALLPIHTVERQASTEFRFRISLTAGRALPARDLAMLSQQIARLLKAGLPLDRALTILITLSGQRRTAQVLRRTLERVRDGASLAEAMNAQDGSFPSSYVSMVRAGETGGALQGVLARLAEFLVRSEAMRQKVVSALIYPAILLVMAALSVGLVLTVVLPQFEPMFREAGANLPVLTRVVMTVGDGLQKEWWIILLGIGLVAVGWQRFMRRPAVMLQRDRVMLAVPLVRSLVSRFEIGRFCRTLSVLLANGVAAPIALALSGAAIGNRVIAAAVADAAVRFKEGEGLSTPLARSGRFPALSIQLIRIGEETGRLEEMLSEVAEIYDQEVQRTLERLLAILVPALTVAMGALIALIIAAVMMAMISINELAV
jgi:general secretion pathway protein F